MKTVDEAANEFAKEIRENSLSGSNAGKQQYQSGRKIGFKAGVKFAQRWIPVEEELPEIPENDYGSKKVLAKTNFGRLDLLRYTRYNGWQVLILNGETVTHWRNIE